MTTQEERTEEFLAHFGVKGMKWGVRKDRGPEGVSRKTNRDAKKDAEEFTRAKMFYGESAGTRRKLIKATVEAKSRRNPAYKKAFDHHVANTDMSKRADQARGQRKRKDVANSTRKTTRGAVHILNGNSQYASAATTVLVGGALYAHRKGIDRAVLNAGKTRVKDIQKLVKSRQTERLVKNLLKNAGF